MFAERVVDGTFKCEHNALYWVDNCYYTTDLVDPKKWIGTAKQMRSRIDGVTTHIKRLRDPIRTNVVIHLRCTDGQGRGNYQFVAKALQYFRSERFAKPVALRIHSDAAKRTELQNCMGKDVNLDESCSDVRICKIVYKSDATLPEVWVDMVNADYLVLGRSSLSYAAGAVSDGIVIFPPDIQMRHVYLACYKGNAFAIVSESRVASARDAESEAKGLLLTPCLPRRGDTGKILDGFQVWHRRTVRDS